MKRFLRASVGALGQLFFNARVPVSLTLALTNRCNQACRYCDIWNDSSDEMTTEQWESVLRDFRQLGTFRVSFTGGEALLRSDLPYLLDVSRRLGLWTSLNTNGWLLPEYWSQISRNLHMLVVSLDGPQEIHDRYCGRPGSHKRVMQSIRLARSSGIPVASITVLDDGNASYLPWILDLSRREGFLVYVQPRHHHCFVASARFQNVSPTTMRKAASTLLAFRSQGFPVGSSSSFLKGLARGAPFPSGCRDCAAGRFFATILPDGRLIPCHLTRDRAPRTSLVHCDAGKAWGGLRAPDDGPGCLIAPYQEMNLMFHGDLSSVSNALRQMIPSGPPR
jgi:MoaA/NifB/PqqE/SkfB family radical SAM enzyme